MALYIIGSKEKWISFKNNRIAPLMKLLSLLHRHRFDYHEEDIDCPYWSDHFLQTDSDHIENITTEANPNAPVEPSAATESTPVQFPSFGNKPSAATEPTSAEFPSFNDEPSAANESTQAEFPLFDHSAIESSLAIESSSVDQVKISTTKSKEVVEAVVEDLFE